MKMLKVPSFLALLSFVMFSCDTEINSDPPGLHSDEYVSKTASSSYREIYCIPRSLSNPFDMYICTCVGTGGNCLPEVVIEGLNSQTYEDFIRAIDEDHLPQYFGNGENWKQIFPELLEYPAHLDAISNGSLSFTQLQTEGEDLFFFALHDSNDEINGSNVAEKALFVFLFRNE